MQTNKTASVILLRGNPVYGEGAAFNSSITPGTLVAVSGVFRTVGSAPSVAAAAAGSTVPTIALEHPIHGIGKNYVEDENVPYIHARRGDVVQVKCTGASPAAGAKLYALANGNVGATAADAAHQPIGIAAGAAVGGLVVMEVI